MHSVLQRVVIEDSQRRQHHQNDQQSRVSNESVASTQKLIGSSSVTYQNIPLQTDPKGQKTLREVAELLSYQFKLSFQLKHKAKRRQAQLASQYIETTFQNADGPPR